MNGYRPLKVMRAGSIRFDDDGVMHVEGWGFHLGGRAVRDDWQRAYRDEILKAVSEFIAGRVNRTVHADDVIADSASAEMAKALIERARFEEKPLRRILRRLWP